MKNFIFAVCVFLMMAFASLSVGASVSKQVPVKSDMQVVDVGTPIIQKDVVKITTMDCLFVPIHQPVFAIAEASAMSSKSVTISKRPFRYVYKSRYCNHYSYTAYSKLITPY